MADSENSVIEINLDTGKIEDSLGDLAGGIDAIKTAVGKLDQSITKGFASGMRLLQGIDAGVANNGRQIANAAKTLSSAMSGGIGQIVSQLGAIHGTMGQVISQTGKMNLADGVGIVSGAMDIGKHIGNAIGNKKGGSEGGEKRSVSETMQNIADKLPFDAEALISSISTVTGKLKEMSLAWAEETKAKILSNAESLKTIAMNAVEHVKAFGVMLGQVAASTAAWLSNTAAMAGHTVATWAQVAATTAWQAICTAATAVTTAFGAAMHFLASPIGIAIAAITALIAIIVLLILNWDTVSQTVQNVCAIIQQKLEQFDGFLQNIFAKDFTEQFGVFGHVINAFVANIKNVWEAIKSVFSGIVTFISGVFSGNWAKAWDGIKEVFSGVWKGLMASVKGPINGIIGYINALVSGLVAGVNLIIKALNGLSFNIPDWVPELGGQTFGFNLTPLTAPRIPLLAQGAVLPANKPFLAVVGDQRHGTNIEAPLTTIQEAVALVMNDQVAAMMAGFEATVEEVRLLRQMVSGIEIGDSTIGQAARRYERKMAVVTGGRY